MHSSPTGSPATSGLGSLPLVQLPLRRVCLALALLPAALLVLSGTAAQGQNAEHPAVPAGYTVAQHILRPGDTFISITQEYLGDAALWQLNQQLNPEKSVRNLRPGDRLSVLLDPQQSPRVAKLISHSGTVEAQANPLDWQGAETNDLLIEQDAARTKQRSSAELEFHDGTTVVITENSLVFIRQLGHSLSSVAGDRKTQSVEIVEGQADLSSLRAKDQLRDNVEVIMGSSTLKLPRESPIKTRMAIASGGASKVSLYEGAASFAAASGSTLDLDRGEGLVAVGTAPPKKEKLLPAPNLVDPPGDSEFVAGSSAMSATWTLPGGGATSYSLEVCRDASCAQLVQRWVELSSTSHDLPSLDAGSYFWRVTAASASGLDGYPSTARPFTVVDLPPDAIPPVVALSLDRFGVPHQGLQAFGPTLPLNISVSDEGTGVARSGLVINGKEQLRSALLSTGATKIAVFAVDRAGQRSESPSIELFVDADRPDLSIVQRAAPALDKRKTPRPRSRRRLRKAKAKGMTFPAKAVFALNREEPIGYSLDSIEWRPLAALETGLLTKSSDLQLVVIDGFCLRSPADQEASAADNVCGLSFLTVTATDVHTGVKILSARLENDELVIEATDEVGNRSELRFMVVAQ